VGWFYRPCSIATDDGVVVASYLKAKFRIHSPETVTRNSKPQFGSGQKACSSMSLNLRHHATCFDSSPFLFRKEGLTHHDSLGDPSFGGMTIQLINLISCSPVLYKWVGQRIINKLKKKETMKKFNFHLFSYVVLFGPNKFFFFFKNLPHKAWIEVFGQGKRKITLS